MLHFCCGFISLNTYSSLIPTLFAIDEAVVSDDEMDELSTIGSGLFAHKVSEDSDNNIIGDIVGVLDDGISDEEENSDILEAVAGEEESNTGILDGITEDGLNFFFNST